MSRFLFIILLCVVRLSTYSQSGRIKPTPTPLPSPRPRVINLPPANAGSVRPLPTPAPKSKAADLSEETIRVESFLVPIPASVTDSSGRPISNLRLEDFQLEIDGKTVDVSDLSRYQIPVRLALLFDNSSTLSFAREFERTAAIRFLKQVLRPGKDQAALFTISTFERLNQPLTADVSQLVQAIQSFPPPEGATALFDGLIKAADFLRTADGRRIIVIVSDGEDNASRIETTLEKTIQAVQSANCQVFVVRTTDFENFKRSGTRNPSSNVRFLTAERRMQEITIQTGGAMYSPIDDGELDAAFTRISAELSDQYVLYYYPEDTDSDGRFRSIALRVKTRKDVTVRARKGYFSPKSSGTRN